MNQNHDQCGYPKQVKIVKPDLKVYSKEIPGKNGLLERQIGTVDLVEGEYIKLKRSDSRDGKHHWIPLSWVDKSDSGGVFLNKSREDVIQTMKNESPLLSEHKVAV